ncbi:hypothetical protein FTO70_04225 [Methanosarcina sp. KYL-1]|uniref:hypothetical protein n=1 Tax=Methanosarcina sp. KYL-1 TaxID=2602068 RepID=UPI002100693A|nr:hypothetical protein [Methanosarcina sp. KYL-1]MCQ1534909.1 hypothetical protein [Methanosarcina sp. KYL-1]
MALISIAAYPAGTSAADTSSTEAVSGVKGQAEAMDVEIIVNPDREVNCLKTMDKGSFKVAVLGSEKLDVEKINVDSVTISCEKSEESVKPIDFEYRDVSSDGQKDLVMAFDCHEMMVKLDLRNCFCEEAPMQVTGSMDETAGAGIIQGSASTLILPRFR